MSKQTYLLTLLSVVVITFMISAPVQAQVVIYVDDDASGANNGSSWADAFTELQSALDGAIAGDEIWVAGGDWTLGR